MEGTVMSVESDLIHFKVHMAQTSMMGKWGTPCPRFQFQTSNGRV